MKLTPEMETKGLKAYEQVRAFEALQRRGLPWIYAGFTGIMVVLGAVSQSNQQARIAEVFWIGGAWFAVWCALNWRTQKARYAENRKLVEEMEGIYGDQLPWVQVENHFAALEKLKNDLAEEKIGAALKDVMESRRREEG